MKPPTPQEGKSYRQAAQELAASGLTAAMQRRNAHRQKRALGQQKRKQADYMIRLRRPRTDDAEIVRLIKNELIPLSYTSHPRDAQVIREIPKRLRQGVTFVASRTKTSMPLGFLHLYTFGDVLLYDMLAVHPQHRGKQLGTKLMLCGEAYGLAQQCRMARLFVDQGNDRAHKLYARLGYETVNYYPDVRCYEMVKSLRPEAVFPGGQ